MGSFGLATLALQVIIERSALLCPLFAVKNYRKRGIIPCFSDIDRGNLSIFELSKARFVADGRGHPVDEMANE